MKRILLGEPANDVIYLRNFYLDVGNYPNGIVAYLTKPHMPSAAVLRCCPSDDTDSRWGFYTLDRLLCYNSNLGPDINTAITPAFKGKSAEIAIQKAIAASRDVMLFTNVGDFLLWLNSNFKERPDA